MLNTGEKNESNLSSFMVNYSLCHQYEFGGGAKYDFLGY